MAPVTTLSRRSLAGFVGGLCLLLIAVAASAQGLVSRYVAGEHYRELASPIASAEDKIRVVEFFQYGCPHCYHLEPAVARWHEQLPDDVAFTRVPVLFGNTGEPYARLYYAAEAMGVIERLHPEIFEAIHENGNRLATEAAIRDFVAAHGVDAERFSEVFSSEETTRKLREAADLMRAYGVRATPSLGVAGLYYVTARMAGSNDALFDVADYLITQARQP